MGWHLPSNSISPKLNFVSEFSFKHNLINNPHSKNYRLFIVQQIHFTNNASGQLHLIKCITNHVTNQRFTMLGESLCLLSSIPDPSNFDEFNAQCVFCRHNHPLGGRVAPPSGTLKPGSKG
jgi:hypothetical protein